MKTSILCAFIITSALVIVVPAQNQFRLNDASKLVDVELDVGRCNDGSRGQCGPLKVRFFRKNARRSFQTITLPVTNVWDPVPKANVTNRYDDQSVINFEDLNFDGVDDVAICDGTNGGYGMPSYQIFLYSTTKKHFVFSRSFTRMNYGGLGMFETDPKRKMHFVYTKSGCCWHQTQGFDVYRGKPRKVYELIEDATYRDGNVDKRGVRITTGKLIRGRWRTWVKYVK
ncbi:MAG: hypothetical protein AB7V11_04000 [Pyrinomonadaceae bacterium]